MHIHTTRSGAGKSLAASYIHHRSAEVLTLCQQQGWAVCVGLDPRKEPEPFVMPFASTPYQPRLTFHLSDAALDFTLELEAAERTRKEADVQVLGAQETLRLERARREAVLRMKAEAEARGHDTIINVRIETSPLASGGSGNRGVAGVEILAFGTAVSLTHGRRMLPRSVV